MASFDIVSKVDPQTLENAVNTAKKELQTRYDFRDTKGGYELNKADNSIELASENSMKIKAMEDILMGRVIKQGLDATCLDYSAEEKASGALIKKTLKVRAGIEKDLSRQIQKLIKDSKLKVEAQIQGDQLRVTAKKIDELQAVIALLRANAATLGQPLQFVNMKS
ncbi:YajQ family cyclic di-GMP-binding protein [Hymenobacter sp. B81]|uniref:YajQ family cyclic di-GMP-binding protein n=1 Tax=Hymenobacter sp. B81 TaxID=3344878 RepID=UPI0037DC2789